MAKIKITKDELTQELLKKLVTYNPTTGVITRNYLSDDMKDYFRACDFTVWNSKAGKQIGRVYKRKCGYKTTRISLLGHQYVTSRIIWLYMTGHWPKNCVDHISGDSSDNRWYNLRDVTLSVNARNRKLGRHNKTGVVGVYEEKHVKGPNKWKAQAFPIINGKKKHLSLGYYPTMDEAIAARKAWENEQGDYTDRHGS